MSPELEFLRPELSSTDLPWSTHRDEGELAVDIFENDQALFVKTAIAGVKPEDLSLALSQDLLTIRGQRTDEHQTEGHNYLTRECHWGVFSRSIILPSNVQTDKAEAVFRAGILLIKLPKAEKKQSIKFRVEE